MEKNEETCIPNSEVVKTRKATTNRSKWYP